MTDLERSFEQMMVTINDIDIYVEQDSVNVLKLKLLVDLQRITDEVIKSFKNEIIRNPTEVKSTQK